MAGLTTAFLITIIVFVIFGRDEEGRSRFQRRALAKKANLKNCDTNCDIISMYQTKHSKGEEKHAG